MYLVQIYFQSMADMLSSYTNYLSNNSIKETVIRRSHAMKKEKSIRSADLGYR